MLINKNGILNMQDIGLEIGPEFTVDELKRNAHFLEFNLIGKDDYIYITYQKSHFTVDNLSFSITLIFYKNKISEMSITYTGLTDKLNQVDVENKKRIIDFINKKNDEWMIKEHGARRCKYPWGVIMSILDDHSYLASIIVIYNSPENQSRYKNFK